MAIYSLFSFLILITSIESIINLKYRFNKNKFLRDGKNKNILDKHYLWTKDPHLGKKAIKGGGNLVWYKK